MNEHRPAPTTSGDQVIIPVAPERHTGVVGEPIVIDLRSTTTASTTPPSPGPTYDIDRHDADETAADNLDWQIADSTAPPPPPPPPPPPAPPGPAINGDLRLVTVEDLETSTEQLRASARALRRENAELTAVINTMRSATQLELTKRDKQLEDLRRNSQEELSRANSRLAAARMQIDFAPTDSSDASGVDADDEQSLHRSALAAETEQLAQSQEAALDERDRALAARDELADERDRALAARDELADERDRALAARDELADERDRALAARDELVDERDHAMAARDRAIAANPDLADGNEFVSRSQRLDDAETEASQLRQQLADSESVRNDLHHQLTTASGDVNELQQQLAAAYTERDGLRQHLAAAKAAPIEAEARATAQLHAALAERDREQAIALHSRDLELNALHEELQQARSDLAQAHESMATLSEQSDAGRVDELTSELSTARTQIEHLTANLQLARAEKETLATDIDDRVQRAFEAGSQLGERAAERLARLLPADAD